jgi:hypothetical protein
MRFEPGQLVETIYGSTGEVISAWPETRWAKATYSVRIPRKIQGARVVVSTSANTQACWARDSGLTGVPVVVVREGGDEPGWAEEDRNFSGGGA